MEWVLMAAVGVCALGVCAVLLAAVLIKLCHMEAEQKSKGDGAARLAEMVTGMMKMLGDAQSARADVTDRLIEQRLETVSTGMSNLGKTVSDELQAIHKTVDQELASALDKKLTESFSTVSQQLERVHSGLGEMQTLAQGVGDLKKVLSNVKTRGILGEVQLRAILQDTLSLGQYEENVATVKGFAERVEFAVKIPMEGDAFIWLPIDSKFPGDTYAALQTAYESGDKSAVDAAGKALCARLRQEAKDIRDKYVRVPETTEFGIMFLPFEGLYAEAVNRGMVETLQHDFRVTIAGPSTMAAMLCSLQMSFRTIAIQRRSEEVWEVLAAVQTEFDRFFDVLEMAQNRVNQAEQELEKLSGTRARAIRRKLRDVGTLPEGKAADILGLNG